MNTNKRGEFLQKAQEMRHSIDRITDRIMGGDYNLSGVTKNGVTCDNIMEVVYELINELYRLSGVKIEEAYKNIEDMELALTHFSSIVCSQLFVGINTNATMNVSYILVRAVIGKSDIADFVLPPCLDMRETFIKCQKKNGSYYEITRVLVATLFFRAYITLTKNAFADNDMPFIKFSDIRNNITVEDQEYIGYNYRETDQFNIVLQSVIADRDKYIKRTMRDIGIKSDKDMADMFRKVIILSYRLFDSSFEMLDGYCKLTYFYAKLVELKLVCDLDRNYDNYIDNTSELFETYSVNHEYGVEELKLITLLAVRIFSNPRDFVALAYARYNASDDTDVQKQMMDIMHHFANGNKGKWSFVKRPMFSVLSEIMAIRHNTNRIKVILEGKIVSLDIKMGDMVLPFGNFTPSIEDVKTRLDNQIKLATYFGIAFVRKIVGSVGVAAQKLNNYMGAHVVNQVFEDIDLIREEIKKSTV